MGTVWLQIRRERPHTSHLSSKLRRTRLRFNWTIHYRASLL